MSEPHGGRVVHGQAEITFRIERSPRRRTVGILVDPEQGVVVRAPRRLSDRAVAEAVAGKAGWILKQQANFAAQGLPLPPRRYEEGEGFLFLGREYGLRLEPQPTASPGPVRLDHGQLVVPVHPALPPERRATWVKTVLARWYRAQAGLRLPARVALYAQALGLALPRVIIADQKSRWGSCNRKGELRLNWRVVMAPLGLVDYLAAHEVCHVLVPNHSPSFWGLLQRVMPDYAQRKALLGQNGWRYRL